MKNRAVIDKIISVVIAIGLWAYVISITNPVGTTLIKSIPVTLLNTSVMRDSGLAIAGSGEYTVDVVVGGTRSERMNLTAADFTAVADVSQIHTGQNYITVEVSAPEGLTVNEIRTQKIQVYADTYTEQEKLISIAVSGVKDGQEIGTVSMDVYSVIVSGAQSLVDTVADVRLNLDASQMELEEASAAVLPLTAVGQDGNRVFGINISPESAEITSTLYNVKKVAVNVPFTGEFPQNVEVISEIIPQSVLLRGPQANLDLIWSVDAMPVDRTQITGSGSVPISLSLPEGVEICKTDSNLRIEYEVIVNAEQSFDFPADAVQLFNIPVDSEAEILAAGDISVTVSGPEATVAKFGAEDISLSADLIGLMKGLQQIPITVDVPEEFSTLNISVAPETLLVNLK